MAGLIGERLALSVALSLTTLIFTYLVAVPIAIYSATHQYSTPDHAFMLVGFVGLATPNFLLALVLMFVAFKFLGMNVGGLFSAKFLFAPWSLAKVADLLQHLPIPIIVIGTAGTAGIIRVCVHPDLRQVIPLAPEFIHRQDGNTKQDCETNAAKRAVKRIRGKHRQLSVIITADSLYSTVPFIRLLESHRFSYLLGVKPDSHKSLFSDVEGCGGESSWIAWWSKRRIVVTFMSGSTICTSTTVLMRLLSTTWSCGSTTPMAS